MFIVKAIIVGSLLTSFLASTVLAQDNPAPVEKPGESVTAGTPLVTATASAKRVRFVSPLEECAARSCGPR